MDAAVQITDLSMEKVLEQNEIMRCSLEAKDHQIKLLEEKINYLLHHRFGSKSERFDDRQQLLFESEGVTLEVEPAVEIEVPAHTRTGGWGHHLADLCQQANKSRQPQILHFL